MNETNITIDLNEHETVGCNDSEQIINAGIAVPKGFHLYSEDGRTFEVIDWIPVFEYGQPVTVCTRLIVKMRKDTNETADPVP